MPGVRPQESGRKDCAITPLEARDVLTRETSLLWAHADRAQATNPYDDDRVDAFRKVSGVPTVLNTSFNESEPLVDPHAHALACS